MPTICFSLKKSLHFKSDPSVVHDPKSRKHLSTILTKRAGRSGCSRSIANLKDVIHGSKRHLEKPPSCSPRSIGSSEFLNPITHKLILSNSRWELKITSFGVFQDGVAGGANWRFMILFFIILFCLRCFIWRSIYLEHFTYNIVLLCLRCFIWRSVYLEHFIYNI